MRFSRLILALLVTLLVYQASRAQQVDTSVRTPREKYIDSIKKSTWPYILPIWGRKIVKRGVDLPYPFGIMANYFVADQKVIISDVSVGINDSPLVPLNFIKFGDVNAHVQTINTRIDIWTIPFIDLYGIIGKTWASTDVNVVEPLAFSTTAKFNGHLVGAGVTLGGAYHRLLMILDYNNTWTSFAEIQGAIHSQMIAPRIGFNFPFNRHPDMNLVPWVGMSGFFVNRQTIGAIPLSDLSHNEGDLGPIIDGSSDWFQNLPPGQQAIVKQIAQKIQDKIDGIDVSGSTIHYSLKKRPVKNWSMIIGTQYQLNHRIQFREEVGFFGGRKSFFTSINYRFGIKR